MKLTKCLPNVAIAVTILGLFPCLHRGLAAQGRPDKRPTLRVPLTDSRLVVDGKLEEPCWKDAAKTGPLKATQGDPATSATEAFILRDAEHLYVGVICAGKDAAARMAPGHTSSFTPGRIAGYAKSRAGELLSAHWAGKPLEPPKEVEFVELLIDSNSDGNSYYLIRITPEDGGKLACSYNEHDPPWCDRTWHPQFESAVAEVVQAYGMEERVCWGSSNDGSAERLRALVPEVCTYYPINAGGCFAMAVVNGDDPLEECEVYDALNIPESAASIEYIEAAHAANIPVYAFTVNERWLMEALFADGVDGVMTDRPDILREVIDAMAR